MKKQSINWGRVLGRLLETGIGGVEGGFRVDETGRLVEDYAQLDGADSEEAYLTQLTYSGELPTEEDDEDIFAPFGMPPAKKGVNDDVLDR